MSEKPAPETDAVLAKGGTYAEMLIHARKLERERDEARATAEKYLTRIQMVEEYKINDILKAERDELRSENAMLRAMINDQAHRSAPGGEVVRKGYDENSK